MLYHLSIKINRDLSQTLRPADNTTHERHRHRPGRSAQARSGQLQFSGPRGLRAVLLRCGVHMSVLAALSLIYRFWQCPMILVRDYSRLQ